MKSVIAILSLFAISNGFLLNRVQRFTKGFELNMADKPESSFSNIAASKFDAVPVGDRTRDDPAEMENEDGEDDDEYDFMGLYDDAPDLDIPYDLIAELEAADARARANKGPSAMDMNKVAVKAAVARWRRDEKDTGSPEVQVAVASERINYLTRHLLNNKKDLASRRGLTALVNDRRVMLNYLYKKNPAKVNELCTELGIRWRPPGLLWDKVTKYGAYKNTKSKFAKKIFTNIKQPTDV